MWTLHENLFPRLITTNSTISFTLRNYTALCHT